MNNIEISCYDNGNGFFRNSAIFSELRVREYLERLLGFLDKDGWEISLVLTGDEEIRELNKTYRGKDEPTDVLSFCFAEGEAPGPQPEGLFSAGDLVISLESLKHNAEIFGVAVEEEFRRLLVHGVLHLAGWDHQTNGADEEMLKFQERILTEIGSLDDRRN